MKKLLTICAAVLFAASANAAETYKFDSSHTNINWTANHFGFSNPSGKFFESNGTVTLDEKNPQNSSVEITIKTESLTTGLSKFDSHLKGEDFLNVKKYPTAKFVSKSVTLLGKNKAKVKGEFTLLGTTKPLTLDVKLNKIGINPFTQRKTAGFSASATLNRAEYGIIYGLPGVSDAVKISIEAEAVLEENAAPAVDKKAETTTENSAANSDWKIIAKDSKLEFKTIQENSTVTGSFKKFSGKINFDPAQLKTSKVSIEIDTTSADVSFSEAADTLHSSSWLATKAFPKATFTAEKFTSLSKKKFRADGKLTLKGKTTPIVLDFTLNEFSKNKAVAVGGATIKRSSFEVGDRDIKKANGVKDEVEISFTISAER